MKTLVTRRQALAAASALALAPFAAGAAQRENVGMQLILAADVSGSVNETRYRTQQDGYLEALGDPRDTVKAELLDTLISSGESPAPTGKTPETGAIPLRRRLVLADATSGGWSDI